MKRAHAVVTAGRSRPQEDEEENSQSQQQQQNRPYNALSEIWRQRPNRQQRRRNMGSSSSSAVTSSDASIPSTPSEGDKLLVKELNQLSLDQREEILEELHGVTVNEIEESPELVGGALKAMEDEIQKIRKRSAYEKAVFVAPNRVKDPEFRLQFLRAVRFEPRPAAQRMVNYYHHKLRLWGFDALTRKITYDDLNDDDVISLKTGSLQFSRKKDAAGRTIATSFIQQHKFETYENHHRMVWYLTMSKLEEDITSQRRGLVAIAYYTGHHLSAKDIAFANSCSFLNEALPMRYSSIHFCYDNPNLRPLMSAVQLFLGTENRLRFRAHFGSHLECMYTLRSFGLPAGALPLDDQFHVMTSPLEEYLNERRAVEDAHRQKEKKLSDEWQKLIELRCKEQGANHNMMNINEYNFQPRVEYPMANDVLLGRGRPYQEFPGNVQLAITIDSYRDEYKSGDRNKKTQLSHRVVKSVKDNGGRFLKRCDDDLGGWIEVVDAIARDKVSHGFRTKTKRNTQNDVIPPTTTSFWSSMVGSTGPTNLAESNPMLNSDEGLNFGDDDDEFQLFHFDEITDRSPQFMSKKLKTEDVSS